MRVLGTTEGVSKGRRWPVRGDSSKQRPEGKQRGKSPSRGLPGLGREGHVPRVEAQLSQEKCGNTVGGGAGRQA